MDTSLTETEKENLITQREEYRREKLVRNGLPRRFSRLDPKDLDFYESLLLIGGTGTGKTHMACQYLLKTEGYFFTVPDLLDEIRSTYDNKFGSGDAALLDKVKDCSFLVLDDLGVEKPSEWVTEKLYQIINHRYNERLRTVITSNMTLDEIAARLGERLVSRLAEMCEIRKVVGADRRIKEKSKP